VVTTLGYIGCFAVWTIVAIIGAEIQRQYGLTNTEFGLLVGVPFLSGSLIRIAVGIWADRHGGRRLFVGVMITAAVATWFVADATTYPMILAARARHRSCRKLFRRRPLLLLCAAAVFWLGSAEDPKQTAGRAAGEPATFLASQIAPLRRLQVWRFGLITSSPLAAMSHSRCGCRAT
jgi:MFS family permease